MAKATPVTEASAGEPAAGADIKMAPVKAPEAPKPAPKADPKELAAMVAEAEAAGKAAAVVGNAVRVDH